MTPICHLSSTIHHLSAPGSFRQDQKTGAINIVLLAYAALDSSWLGTSSRSPAPKLEWETGISVGLS